MCIHFDRNRSSGVRLGFAQDGGHNVMLETVRLTAANASDGSNSSCNRDVAIAAPPRPIVSLLVDPSASTGQ